MTSRLTTATIATWVGSRHATGILGRPGIRKGRHGREAPSAALMLIVATTREISTDGLGARVAALPGFAAARAAAERAGAQAYLVGGAVRDTLLGRPALQLDLVVEGDQGLLVEALGGPALIYDRFETATVRTASGEVDVARARAETYPRPGALPEVRPATIAEDLDRRDFTVNALAVPLADPDRLIDPHGGVDDLARRACCGSCTTARSSTTRPGPCGPPATRPGSASSRSRGRWPCCARRIWTPSPETGSSASSAKLAEEDDPRAGFELLEEWGLVPLGPGAGELIEAVAALLSRPPWQGIASRPQAVIAAIRWRRRPHRRTGRDVARLAVGGGGDRARAQRRGAGGRARRRRRVARRLRGALARRAARDHGRGPAGGRRPGGARASAAASTRRCARSSTARRPGRDDELRIALAAAGSRSPPSLEGMDWRERDGVRWLEAELPGARAAFSTRVGGASSGPFESLNLGLYTDDAQDAVRANRARLAAALDRDRRRRAVRLPGPRRRDRAPRARSQPEPVQRARRPAGRARRPGDLEPRPDARWSRSPTACRSRSPASAAWRCSTAAGAGSRPGSSTAGCRGGRRDGRGDRARDRPLLLRGRRRGPGGVRGARRRDRRRADARPARGRAPPARPRRASAPSSRATCARAASRELFFSHRRDAGRTGRQAGLAWIDG